MKRIRQGWNTLRRNSRSGVSLIVALCAVAVLIGLSLSIVYSSSMLLSRANRKIGRERCYQLAKSFAEVLTDELEAYNTEDPDLGGEDDKVAQAADQPFYRYANYVLENFPAYDSDYADERTYYYTTGNVDDEYGKVTVSLRSMPTEATKPRGDQFHYEERQTKIAAIATETFLHYQLMVRVKVELEADSYMYTTQYQRKDAYKLVYTWKGSVSGEFPVYWVDGKFCRSDNAETEVTPSVTVDENGESHEEIVMIAYDYLSTPTYKVYSPMYSESGGGNDE